jgi:hypothetical protein
MLVKIILYMIALASAFVVVGAVASWIIFLKMTGENLGMGEVKEKDRLT